MGSGWKAESEAVDEHGNETNVTGNSATTEKRYARMDGTLQW